MHDYLDDRKSPTLHKSDGYFRSDEVAQVNINLEFHSAAAMKYSLVEQQPGDSLKIEKRHKVC